MNTDLKIGDYVKTDSGRIGKIIDIDDKQIYPYLVDCGGFHCAYSAKELTIIHYSGYGSPNTKIRRFDTSVNPTMQKLENVVDSLMQTSSNTGYETIRETRKKEGRCEECGELLPISVHGLGECKQHPKPLPPDFKQ